MVRSPFPAGTGQAGPQLRPRLALLVVACVLLAGCGSSSSASSDLGDVSVSGRFGEPPSVKTGQDFHVDRQGVRQLLQERLAVHHLAGPELDHLRIRAGTRRQTGRQPHARRDLAEDGYGKDDNPQSGIDAEDTLVFVIDIVAKTPSEATGAKQRLPPDLPTIKFDEAGHPKGFAAAKSTPERVDKLQVGVAIRGRGPKVRPKQSLTMQYVGQIYPDGSVFDRSWGRAPASFQFGVGDLIPCWDKRLVGQPVGSRVVLVCPPGEGYRARGNEQTGITGTDSLVFAIDILAAQAPPASR